MRGSGRLTPDASDRARFHDDCARLIAAGPPGPVIVAFSGGPDSLALLLLMRAELGGDVRAATVDHGLRTAAAAEADGAARLCAGLGVPHAILRGTLPDRVDGSANLSQRARALRYRLLDAHRRDSGAGWIATGHHADDQLETMLMRLNRGAGAAGLAGIRAVQGRVVRPLLTWRRRDLARIAAASGLPIVDDPTNRDGRFDRARLRGALAPVDWLDPAGFTRSAACLADMGEAVDWAVDQAAARCCRLDDAGATMTVDGLPREVRRRLAMRCIRHVDPEARPRGDALDRVLSALDRGERATVAGVLCDGIGMAGDAASTWRFAPAPTRRPVRR